MGRQRLETVNLPEYLPKQRWFAGKSRRIKSTRIVNWAPLDDAAFSLGAGRSPVRCGRAGAIPGAAGNDVRRRSERIAARRTQCNRRLDHIGRRYPACCTTECSDDNVCLELLSLIENQARAARASRRSIRGVRGKAFQEILGSAEMPLPVRRSLGGAKQYFDSFSATASS